jgi:hypothetical protein
MKNLIVYTISILINIYVFGQIYLFWIKRIRPALQKQIDTSLRSSSFLHRNFPATMRYFQIKRNSEI